MTHDKATAVRMPAEMHQQVERAAKTGGFSVAEFIRQAIREKLEKEVKQ